MGRKQESSIKFSQEKKISFRFHNRSKVYLSQDLYVSLYRFRYPLIQTRNHGGGW